MALLDLLGRRWALRVLWELRGGEALTFRELQERCGGISSSVLNDRLRELREAGIVGGPARGGAGGGRGGGAGGYALTRQGAELLRALEPVGAWAKRWRPVARHAAARDR